MAGTINPYFNPYGDESGFGTWNSEQRMLESMNVEVASIFGVQCYYVAANWNSFDQLYGATESTSFTHVWPLAMAQKNVLGFTGDKEFMSKFAGLQIRDQITFSIPRLTFDQVIRPGPRFPKGTNKLPTPDQHFCVAAATLDLVSIQSEVLQDHVRQQDRHVLAIG